MRRPGQMLRVACDEMTRARTLTRQSDGCWNLLNGLTLLIPGESQLRATNYPRLNAQAQIFCSDPKHTMGEKFPHRTFIIRTSTESSTEF